MIAIHIPESYLIRYIRYYHRGSMIKGRIQLPKSSLVRKWIDLTTTRKDLVDLNSDDVVFFENKSDSVCIIKGKEALPIIRLYDDILKQSFRSYMAGATLTNPDSSITELIRNWLDEFHDGDDDKLVSRLRKDWQRHGAHYAY